MSAERSWFATVPATSARIAARRAGAAEVGVFPRTQRAIQPDAIEEAINMATKKAAKKPAKKAAKKATKKKK